MQRIAAVATIALDLLLLLALVVWQWLERQPSAAVRGGAVQWQLPIVLATLALAAGAVALISSRRANLITLFLIDFATVLVAAWLFQHLYQRFALARLLTGR